MEHPKEVAEHVMLVDLARNDIGRVISFGTESRDQVMTLEHYSHVMHLTSQVSGDLAPGRRRSTCCGRRLPAGTVSGAPKVRAMEIIDELEPVKRGPYAGVVGYIDFSGNDRHGDRDPNHVRARQPARPFRPAPGSSPTVSPSTSTRSASTNRRRCSLRYPAPA